VKRSRHIDVESTTRVVLVLIFSIIAPRLPAPVQEIPENPTPAATPSPKLSATPKPKRTARPSTTTEVSERVVTPKPHASPLLATAHATPTPNIFAGQWIGSMHLWPASDRQGIGRIRGNFETHFEVSADGTSIVESAKLGKGSETTWRSGNAIRWRSSIFKQMTCELRPDADGKTAVVTCTSDFYENPYGNFQKVAPGQ
jgi:hypothetical protein